MAGLAVSDLTCLTGRLSDPQQYRPYFGRFFTQSRYNVLRAPERAVRAGFSVLDGQWIAGSQGALGFLNLINDAEILPDALQHARQRQLRSCYRRVP